MKENGAVHPRVRRYACCEREVMYEELQTGEEGLRDEQAEEDGRISGRKAGSRQRDSVWYRLRRAFVNPFSIILFAIAGISFVTDGLLASNFSRNLTTVIIILVMLLLCGLVRLFQELHAKRVADRLGDFMETTAAVLRQGQWKELPGEELAVGDRVRLRAGDRVPADIRLVKTMDLFVTQSVISGESEILEKDAKRLAEKELFAGASLSAYRNTVFKGTTVIGGTGEGIVLAIGRETVYGEFSDSRAFSHNRFDKGAASIAWVLIRFMAVLVPLVFIACGLVQGNWAAAFLFALSVAVGLTPEMLPMVINACLVRATMVMRRKETVVRNINAMQNLGSMDVLCVDKTGTLTGDRVLLEYYLDVLGNESSQVLEYGYLNSFYHSGVGNHLDRAILQYRSYPGREAYFEELPGRYPKLDEKPFDYLRKFASVLVAEERENLLLVKGSPEQVCARCSCGEYRGEQFSMEKDDLRSVHAVIDEMIEDGMKVLAVAYRRLPSDCCEITEEQEQGLTLLGYLVFFDAPKKSAVTALEQLRRLHVGIRVLTGDHAGVAASICRRLGISTDGVITGAMLQEQTEDERRLTVERSTVFAELTPKQKEEIVTILQENGHVTGFLGDGLNDLPAMQRADVGISVDTASQTVRESADVILLKKDLNVLEEGVLEGRKAFANMAKYIRITASSNFGNIFSIVIASVLLPFLPMTSVQLLLLNLLYDLLCLALPWDRVDAEVYERPQQWTGKTLGRFMGVFGPISSIFDLATFAFLYFVLCPAVCGGSFAQVEGTAAQGLFIALFQTGWFLESMWSQVLILQLLRTRKVPILQSKPSKVVMAVTVIGISAFTAMLWTPVGRLLGLTPMPAAYFLFLVAVVVLYMLFVTVVKSWYLRKYQELVS